ncbi:MAG: hypothetical protein WBS19_13905, partial [Candidatus Korobacteraceae bacterium]
MTLCVAAICQDRGNPRIVIATDWKASNVIAGAENQDKLRWIDDNTPAMLAGTITRAFELISTYRQYLDTLSKRNPPETITRLNRTDVIRRPAALQKNKIVDEYTGMKFGLSYKEFRIAVSRKEIPKAIAAEVYADIQRLDLDCCLIIPTFIEKTPFIFKIDDGGSIEECDNFAAIGTGETIAEAALFQRKQEDRMTLGRTVYHVYEAMRLGSIASDVGEEHTIDVLYPPGQRGPKIAMDTTTDKADKFLKAKFKK